MKACNHFIISNSSLSWWAQFLGECKEKTVLAPSKWLNFGHEGDRLYQDNWELIEV